MHQLTYHGVLAPGSSWRSELVPSTARERALRRSCGAAGGWRVDGEVAWSAYPRQGGLFGAFGGVAGEGLGPGEEVGAHLLRKNVTYDSYPSGATLPLGESDSHSFEKGERAM